MNENEITHIKRQIENQKWNYWKSNKLTDFLTANNMDLSHEDLYELTKHLIKEDVFGFLDLIANVIPDLASTNEDFIEILESVIDEIKNDMAQGPVINSLIFIGKSNPVLAMYISGKLLESSNPEYSSFLIGGAFTELSEECNALIAKLRASENPRHQVAAIKALRVIYKDSKMKDKQKIFKILKQASESDFIEVKSEVLEAFLDVYEENTQKSKMVIENLARSHTKCRHSLATRIRFHPPFDEETALHFLEICSEDSDINVKRPVLFALASFVEKYPNRVLEILAKYANRDGFDFEGMGHVLSELGKINTAIALVTILGWLKKEHHSRLNRCIPVMVRHLVSKTNKKVILEPIFQLIDSEPKFVNVGMNVLLEIISDIYERDADSELIPILFNSLDKFANKRGIDITSVTKNEDNPILQCADAIRKIKNCPKSLDYDSIIQNLSTFSSIKGLFGDSWFELKRREDNRTHPILNMLEQKLPSSDKCDELIDLIKNAKTIQEKFNHALRLNNLTNTTCFLQKLDQNIKTMKDKGLSTRGYSKNLKNEPQFDATLSEIDFIVPFLSHYEVELEPKINSKHLDAKIKIGSQAVYVEVISPNMFKPLANLRGARAVPNRIKGKIYDEFKHHLRGFDSTEQPIIVAIDMGSSEVTDDFVEDYLLGPLKFKMYFDEKKVEAGDSYAYRDEEESMHKLEPETDLISAVVCYQMHLYDDLSYKMKGKIIENSHAKIPLCHDVRKIIEKTLFTDK